MRYFLMFFLSFPCLFFKNFAQDLSGVYLLNNNGNNQLILIKDGYITHTNYTEKKYNHTQGGTYKTDKNYLIVNCEFDDKDIENVNKTHKFHFQINKNILYINELPFVKQATNNQDLDGLWRISGRRVNEKMQTIQRSDRKTIKLLVDGYFQWIAINPTEKGFYGTGGGKYSFQHGSYQENILFFSRDNNRVSALLNFTGEIQNNEWHHSGKNSKGEPIYEIWSRDN